MEALTILLAVVCYGYVIGVLPIFVIAEVYNYRNKTPVHYRAEDTILTAAFWPAVVFVYVLETQT